jgi:hypothetical protein
MRDPIRFIDYDDFRSKVEDGTFVYLQADKEDILSALDSMVIYELSADNIRLLMTKYLNGEQI